MAGPAGGTASAACTASPAARTSPNAPTRPCSVCEQRKINSWPSPSTSPRAAASAPRPGCVRSAATRSCVSPNDSATMPNASTTRKFDTSTPNRFKPMRPGPLWKKKDKQCNPDDPEADEQGSYWDHVIIDPETKWIVSMVVGRRTADTVVQVFTDFYDRTDGALPELITTDGYTVYEPVILDTYGLWLEEMELSKEA